MQLHHIGIYVQDIERVSHFFETYFELEKIDFYHNPTTDFRSRFLHFIEGPAIELMHRPEMMEAQIGNEDRPRPGYHHASFSVGSAEAVDRLTEQLWNDGFRVLSGPRTTGDGYYEAQIEGPEGIIIELTI